MHTQALPPLVASHELAEIVDHLDDRSGGAAFIAVALEDGSVQARHSGGADMVRAAAASALIRMRQLALPGAPTCPGCAARLADAEAALRALRVDERCWVGADTASRHVH